MIILDQSEEAVYFDVDGVLVHHGQPKGIKIVEPYTKEKMVVTPDDAHIRLLKKKFCMGVTTIVWSHAGVKWAQAVVEALELQEYVTAIIPKLVVYVDDNEFAPDSMQLIRLYFPNGWGKSLKEVIK